MANAWGRGSADAVAPPWRSQTGHAGARTMRDLWAELKQAVGAALDRVHPGVLIVTGLAAVVIVFGALGLAMLADGDRGVEDLGLGAPPARSAGGRGRVRRRRVGRLGRRGRLAVRRPHDAWRGPIGRPGRQRHAAAAGPAAATGAAAPSSARGRGPADGGGRLPAPVPRRPAPPRRAHRPRHDGHDRGPHHAARPHPISRAPACSAVCSTCSASSDGAAPAQAAVRRPPPPRRTPRAARRCGRCARRRP